MVFLRSAFAAAIMLMAASSAYAGDPRCDAPPYGDTTIKFQAFVKAFGTFVTPTHMLPAVCNAKYGGSPRTGMYNLGFTDQEIDSKSTIDLAVAMIMATKEQIDK